MRGGWACAIAVAVATIVGCSSAQTRPQLVVFLDTDAPVVGQLAGSPTIAADGAVDTVRVDVIGNNREVVEVRDFTVPDSLDWPLSFGIASEEGTSRHVTLRIRAFRASRGSRGTLAGATTLEPPQQAVIDRVVELERPEVGVKTVSVVLAAACFGAAASFEAPVRTCVDAQRRKVAPVEGVLETVSPTRVGTAVEAQETPCAQPSPKGAHCIPGGLTLLGDERLAHPFQGTGASPPRPVVLSPFHMDETEFTVGRFRFLQGIALRPLVRNPSHQLQQFATWLGPTNAANDAYPLNFVSFELATAVCAAVGGHLPTEAQWEHAARGRGLGYTFPWGNEAPKCCSTSASRPFGVAGELVECPGRTGAEPVGSHTGKGCDGPSDVSRDGILDLAGSMSEATLDGGLAYTDACWSGPGLVTDPACKSTELRPGTAARGASWNHTFYLLASALRTHAVMPSATAGFRCVYDDVP